MFTLIGLLFKLAFSIVFFPFIIIGAVLGALGGGSGSGNSGIKQVRNDRTDAFMTAAFLNEALDELDEMDEYDEWDC